MLFLGYDSLSPLLGARNTKQVMVKIIKTSLSSKDSGFVYGERGVV